MSGLRSEAGYEMQAREMLSLPPEWEMYRSEMKGTYPEYYGIEITGSIPRTLKSGSNKGQKTFRDRRLEATVLITNEAREAWLSAWERKTGRCSDCEGLGQVFANWTPETGRVTKPCKKCNATGAA